MAKYNILKHDVFLTGPVLREVGASVTDENGIVWAPRDQMISRDGRSVTLTPDPESLRLVFVKWAKAFAGKTAPAVSGAKNGPAYAYNRLLARPGMKALMMRLQRRGLIPRAPHSYATLKPAAFKNPALKPRVSPMATIQKSITLLNIQPGGLEAMASALPEPVGRAVSNTLKILGPKRRGPAYNFG